MDLNYTNKAITLDDMTFENSLVYNDYSIDAKKTLRKYMRKLKRNIEKIRLIEKQIKSESNVELIFKDNNIILSGDI